MSDLEETINIGKILAEQLHLVRIYTIDDLRKVGSKNAWLKIKVIDPSACLNRLYALEGAIQNIRWHDLSKVDKNRLREFLNSYSQNNKEEL